MTCETSTPRRASSSRARGPVASLAGAPRAPPSCDGENTRLSGLRMTGLAALRGLGALQLPLAIEDADAVDDPRVRGLVLQIVTEPLKDAPLVIDLVRLLAQPVILPAVGEQDDILLRAPSDVVQLDALVPEHRAVGVADLDEQRRPHVLHVDNRGVPDVRLQIVVQRHLHPLLPGLDVIGLGDPRAPGAGAVIG